MTREELAEYIKEHGKEIYSFCRWLARSGPEADELYQDTWLLVVQKQECLDIFADHTIYLCVTDTDFYRKGLYNYDEEDGSISRSEDYAGLNALFVLEMDASKADPAAAQALLEGNRKTMELDEQEEQAEPSDDEVSRFLAELTLENLAEKCVLLEDTCQTVMPDEEGMVHFTYLLPGEDPSYQTHSPSILVDWWFRRPWGDDRHVRLGDSSGELTSLVIYIYTLNEDGSVSFEVYVPRDVSVYLH